MEAPKKLTVELCMGSSCFARGNKEALPLIIDYLERQGLKECVDLKGHLCVDHCSQGPLMRIGEETYRGLTPEAAVDLLKHWCEK